VGRRDGESLEEGCSQREEGAGRREERGGRREERGERRAASPSPALQNAGYFGYIADT